VPISGKMKSFTLAALLAVSATITGCSRQDARGIADRRTDFRKFLPMRQDPVRDGLRVVKPYFRQSDRTEIMRAIERACDGSRRGSSVYDPRTGRGYYVNCNPKNRQLLNGYVPITPSQQPHSR
jgi:uncharacterized protein (DUF2147 family)